MNKASGTSSASIIAGTTIPESFTANPNTARIKPPINPALSRG